MYGAVGFGMVHFKSSACRRPIFAHNHIVDLYDKSDHSGNSRYRPGASREGGRLGCLRGVGGPPRAADLFSGPTDVAAGAGCRGCHTADLSKRGGKSGRLSRRRQFFHVAVANRQPQRPESHPQAQGPRDGLIGSRDRSVCAVRFRSFCNFSQPFGSVISRDEQSQTKL